MVRDEYCCSWALKYQMAMTPEQQYQSTEVEFNNLLLR